MKKISDFCSITKSLFEKCIIIYVRLENKLLRAATDFCQCYEIYFYMFNVCN